MEFQNLFRYRATNVMNEMLSVICTPLILWFSLPKQAGMFIHSFILVFVCFASFGMNNDWFFGSQHIDVYADQDSVRQGCGKCLCFCYLGFQ